MTLLAYFFYVPLKTVYFITLCLKLFKSSNIESGLEGKLPLELDTSIR